MKKYIFFRKRLITELAEELAYIQIRADYWFYINKNQDMSSYKLELATEVREIASRLGILKEVYESAYRIYDFRNSGKKDYQPDIELLKILDKQFCEPRKKTRGF